MFGWQRTGKFQALAAAMSMIAVLASGLILARPDSVRAEKACGDNYCDCLNSSAGAAATAYCGAGNVMCTTNSCTTGSVCTRDCSCRCIEY